MTGPASSPAGPPPDSAAGAGSPASPLGGAGRTGARDGHADRWEALGGQFAVAHHRVGAASVLDLTGELDIGTVVVLEEALGQVTTTEMLVVLDLRGLSFGDSTMLSAIMTAARRLRSQGGDLRLAGASGPVRQVIEITGVVGDLPLYDSVDDALTARTGPEPPTDRLAPG